MPADLPPANVSEIASAGTTTDLAIRPFKELDLGPDATGATAAVDVRGGHVVPRDGARTKTLPHRRERGLR